MYVSLCVYTHGAYVNVLAGGLIKKNYNQFYFSHLLSPSWRENKTHYASQK